MTVPLSKCPLSGMARVQRAARNRCRKFLAWVYFQNSRFSPCRVLQAVFRPRGVHAHSSNWKLPGYEGYCQCSRRTPLRAGFFYLRATTSDIACHHRKSNRWTDEPGKNTSTCVPSDFITALSLKGFEFFSVSHIYVYILFSAYMQNALFR